MNKHRFTIFAVLWTLMMTQGCTPEIEDDVSQVDGIPTVKADATYSVNIDEDISYANGLAHDLSSHAPSSTPLLLDVYYPNTSLTNRPVYMFIHGGGFKGGTKTKPEIIDMANYYASRGWVFVSIDYRTAEELGSLNTIEGLTSEELLTFYKGIAPQEWISSTLEGAETYEQIQQGIAMYTAQRDAKAALRWIVANATSYDMDIDFITVGGASAGAITTLALGISDEADFKDEITISDDPTLSSTNLTQSYNVTSMVYFWGSNVKLELFESIYGEYPYDSNDPELFMAHGTHDVNPSTPYTEAVEMESIYNTLGIYNELHSLENQGHGAWHATIDGKGSSELTFDFIVERQSLVVN